MSTRRFCARLLRRVVRDARLRVGVAADHQSGGLDAGLEQLVRDGRGTRGRKIPVRAIGAAGSDRHIVRMPGDRDRARSCWRPTGRPLRGRRASPARALRCPKRTSPSRATGSRPRCLSCRISIRPSSISCLKTSRSCCACSAAFSSCALSSLQAQLETEVERVRDRSRRCAGEPRSRPSASGMPGANSVASRLVPFGGSSAVTSV